MLMASGAYYSEITITTVKNGGQSALSLVREIEGEWEAEKMSLASLDSLERG